MERGGAGLVRAAHGVRGPRDLSGAPSRAHAAPRVLARRRDPGAPRRPGAPGQVDLARQSATELEAIAREYGSTAWHASAAQARGAVQVAEGAADAAVPNLRRACKLWQEVQLPYETATARLLLAGAYRTTGHSEDAERSEEHTSELQSRLHLVCRLLLEKKKKLSNKQTCGDLQQGTVLGIR